MACISYCAVHRQSFRAFLFSSYRWLFLRNVYSFYAFLHLLFTLAFILFCCPSLITSFSITLSSLIIISPFVRHYLLQFPLYRHFIYCHNYFLFGFSHWSFLGPYSLAVVHFCQSFYFSIQFPFGICISTSLYPQLVSFSRFFFSAFILYLRTCLTTFCYICFTPFGSFWALFCNFFYFHNYFPFVF